MDKGLLKYGDKISKYWPEFAQKGKGHITVRQLMMHQAGLAGFSRKVSDPELFNPDAMSRFLETEELNWPVRDETEGWKRDGMNIPNTTITTPTTPTTLCNAL